MQAVDWRRQQYKDRKLQNRADHRRLKPPMIVRRGNSHAAVVTKKLAPPASIPVQDCHPREIEQSKAGPTQRCTVQYVFTQCLCGELDRRKQSSPNGKVAAQQKFIAVSSRARLRNMAKELQKIDPHTTEIAGVTNTNRASGRCDGLAKRLENPQRLRFAPDETSPVLFPATDEQSILGESTNDIPIFPTDNCPGGVITR